MAVLIGCTLPIQAMGRGAIAGAVILALLSFLSLPQKAFYVKRAFGAARHPLGLLLLVLFILWLPNVFYSIDPLRSLGTGVRPFIFIGLATLFWAVLIENQSLHSLILRTVVLVSALAIILTLIAQIAVPELFWFMHFKGWIPTSLHASLKPFASLGIFLIPVFVFAGFRLSRPWAWLAAANIAGILALIELTGNKATIAGLLGMVLLGSLLLAVSGRSRLVKIILPLAALAVFAGILIWFNISLQRVDLGDDWLFPLWLIDFQRQTIWRFAYELWQQNFWFGLGINTINFAPGADATIPNTLNLKLIPSHPHNWMLEVAAAKGWRVSGCDLSAAMIDVARVSDPEDAVDWALLSSDAPLPLPYETATFNGVVSSSVFEYLASPEDVLAEISRILAPDGWFLFTVPDPAHPVRVRETKKAALARFNPFWQVIRHTRWANQYRYLRISVNRPPIDVWATMLRHAGLVVRDTGPGDDPLAIIVAQKPATSENDTT